MAASRQRRWARWVLVAVLLAVPGAIAAIGCAPGGDDGVTDAIDARDEGGGEDGVDVEGDGEASGPPPTLAAVSPPSGPIAGGTLVTLTGENIALGATATFGGTACTDAFPASARRMTCRTPAHAAGAVDVVLTNPDGQSATLAGAFTYDASGPRVNWCLLYYPPEISAAPDEPAGPIYGRLLVQDVTRGEGQGAGVRGQVGVGAAGSDPATWTWGEATYNASVDGIVSGDLANDEYAATILGRPEGEYSYAFRFSVDDGATWELCDRTGTDDGFDVSVAGLLHVVPGPPPSIGWCALDRPAATSADVATETAAIYGRVLVAGVTEGDGQGTGVTAQVGVGLPGTDPRTGGWTWTSMGYADSVDGTAPGDLAVDEYGSPVDAPAEAGSYVYAVRFSVDAGASWTICDTSGAGYSEINAGRLTATDPATGPLVGWCNLQWPSSLHATAGTPTDHIYGRVWVEGVTTLVGQGAGIRGQVGYGAPSAAPATWTWVEAGYNVDADGLTGGDHANDEYWQQLTVPAAGTYAYAYRFTMDGGSSWRTCDLDGTTVGEFTIDQAGTLVVE
ncbi:MAG: IPT/TIG domain-containing protein [Deltaproteobacteria bacterium]|nr:IPT/TIG domain-containing protein [Deltaproteobacteria bacterium]